MKRILFLAFILLSLTSYAQNDEIVTIDTTKAWNFGGVVGLTFSQVGLTNWAAGGDNSVNATGLLRLSAIYKQNKNIWETRLLTSYGLQKIGKDDFQKNEDKLEFFSKYGREMNKKWYYTANLNFRSQWSAGYASKEDSVKISSFFAPAYITLALGFDYKPNDNFALLFAPLSTKLTMVLDDSLSANGAYGVDPGSKIRSEFGGSIKLVYIKKDIVKNVDFATNLDLFSNYLENPEKIDVNWEVLIDMNINKFLTATFNANLIYDYDVKFTEIENGVSVEKDKVQFKELFGIGLTYRF